MRKKVLACILLSILLINSLVTPIAYSLDNVVPNPDEVTQVEPKASDDSSEEEDTTAEKLDVSLTPENQEESSDDSKVTEENAEAEEKKEVAEEQPQQNAITSQEVTIPKVSIYKEGDKETKDIAATFRLVQASNSSELARWSSDAESPKVELSVGTIYLLKVVDLDSSYVKPADVKIRLADFETFERLDGDNWTTFETLDIAAAFNRRALLRVGASGALGEPEVVDNNTIAPINRLQIIGNMPTTSKVELLSIGGGVQRTQEVWGNANNDNPIWGGGFDTDLDSVIAEVAPGHNALTIEFKPSDYNASNYANDPDAGWNADDLSLDTTSMWVKVRYTDAAYYDGQLVDAVATIKVTPFKNRTNRSQNNPNGGYDYWGDTTYADESWNKPVYYPTIQISGLLYGGWVWQNVKEFDVDLSFYEKGSSTPITLKGGLFSDTEATYYTINSLNPQYNYSDGGAHGPEYVLPDSDTYLGAYKIANSNISTEYKGDNNSNNQEYTQYAYNGGDTNRWGDDDDKPTSPNWSKNSVMFTTSDTSNISFTMGNLMRKPGKRALDFPNLNWNQQASSVYRTNYIWTTINTDSFTDNKVVTKDVHVRKDWVGHNNPTNDIVIELWSTWKQDGEQQNPVLGQVQTLTAANGWQTDFKNVPDEASMQKILEKANPGTTITDFKYEAVERNLPDGYKVKYSGASDAQGGFVITNTQTHTGLTITKSWLVNGTTISNQDTSTFGKLKVTLKRRVGNQIDTSFNQVVELEYNSNASTSWKKTINNLPIQNDEDKDYTYFIEEDLSTLPTNFELHGYRNTNSDNYVTDGSQAGIPLKYDPAQNNLGVTNNKTKTSLTITKVWLENGQAISNQNTSDFGPIKVTLKRKFGQTGDGQFSQVVELKYDSDASLSWKATVDNLPMKDSYGRVMTYYIEEDVSTLPANFYIKSYVNDKQLDPNPTNNQLSVTNERLTGNITIRKLWYMSDGETLLANGELPSRLKVKLYRTTNGQTTGGELFKEITLIRQGTEGNYRWTLTEPVPITDNNKNFYTYYIEEEQPVGYLEISVASEKTTTFTSSNYQTTPTLTVKNKVNPVYPSTGGFGSRPFMMIGITSLFVAVILYYMQKKKIFWRKEK